MEEFTINEIFPDKDRVYTVTEIAEIAKVHPQTLRNWEEIGILTPQRSGGRRVYGKKELLLIEKILFLKAQGLNIKAIKFILSEGFLSHLSNE